MKVDDYYKSWKVLREILESVDDPGHRIWKVEYADGTFKQNWKQINTSTKLKELLLLPKRVPSKVYVSVSKWLNPQKVYGKNPKDTAWKVADSVFLGSYLLFDCDHYDNLKIPYNDCKKIIKYMANKHDDYELENIRYSGTKGFHLLYKDTHPIKEDDPLERLKKTEEKRKFVVDGLPKLQTIDSVHKNIIIDQFRVHAVIGTIKASSGHKVRKISPLDFLTLPFKEIEELCHTTLVRPIRSMKSDEHLTSIQGKERPGVISFPYYYNFVSNKVKGIKDSYITVLKFPKNKRVTGVVRALQRKYKLGSLYMFTYKNIQMWLSCKLVSKARLDKIMKAAKPMNLNSYLHYGHTWIPISEAIDEADNVIWEKARFVGVYKSKSEDSDTHSKPHARLLGLEFKQMAGDEMNRVCKAIIKEV